jgi:hypothetical protein
LRGLRGRGVADILFARVPERKQVKNRLHIDLRPDDQAAEIARAEALGARLVDVGQADEFTWVVMVDPEGNEFCILRAFGPEDGVEPDRRPVALRGAPDRRLITLVPCPRSGPGV